MQSYSFLFWAYNVVWIGLAAYMLMLFLRMKRAARRLDGVEQELKRRGVAGGD